MQQYDVCHVANNNLKLLIQGIWAMEVPRGPRGGAQVVAVGGLGQSICPRS